MDAIEPEIHEPVPVIASHEPEDPPSTYLSLETRFERILKLVEEAGFDTLDGMAAAYYTAKFQPDSRAHYAQFQSRTRYLRPFLQALNVNSTDWPRREAAGYKDGIARSAVGVYVEELVSLRQRQQQQQIGEAGSPASTGSSDGPDTASLGSRRAATFAEKFRRFFMAVDASQGVKGDSQVFRQQVGSFSFYNSWLCPLMDSPLDRSMTNKPPTPPAHRSHNYGLYSPNLPTTPNCPNPKVPKLSAAFYTSSVYSHDPSFYFLPYFHIRSSWSWEFLFVLSIRTGRIQCASNGFLYGKRQ